MREAERAVPDEGSAVRQVGAKTFVNRNGVWIDTQYDATRMTPEVVPFGSDRYFELASDPVAAEYLSLGSDVIYVHEGAAIQVSATAEASAPTPTDGPEPDPSDNRGGTDQDKTSTDLWQAFMEWIAALFGTEHQ
jgi:hypothetical protein